MNGFYFELGRYFSLYVGHSLMFYIMTDCRFSRWVNRWVWALLCLGSTFVSVLLTYLGLFEVSWIYSGLSVITMTSYIVCYVCLSRGPWLKKLCLFSIYVTIFYLMQQTAYIMGLIFSPANPWASVILRTAFFALLFLLMCWRWRQVVDALEANIGGSWGVLASYGLATATVVYAVTLVCIVKYPYEPVYCLIVMLTELALVVVEYAALVRIVIMLGQQQTARAEEAQRKLLESQLAAERAYVEQARAHRHDMRHYMAAIGGYIEQGDLAGARACLAEHQALLDNERLPVFCENTVANALLRLYQSRCQSEGVACEIRTAIPEQMALGGLELATVLGNVLENACEANSRALLPWLMVKAYNNNGLLLIEVGNGVSGEVKFREGLPQTNKPGGGLGLKNVVQVLDRHGGMLQCSQRGDCFFTQIIVPL